VIFLNRGVSFHSVQRKKGSMENKEFYILLRAIKRWFSRSAKHKRVMDKGKHPSQRGPRGGSRYVCEKCGKLFARKDIQVDHIDPVIPLNKKALGLSWNYIISRLDCPEENLQRLCKSCHKKKSIKENSKRKKLKQSIKKDR